ncbi:Uncharacterized protein Adt_23701 [Abeliophyllum distichum]|uniref:Uncharacterized protein n=1 Tax=Abeliophyllum distichum TaxID=126358 RepID=A0ABD1SCF4_9LAMI
MSITLRDVGALVNLPPLGDTISPAILISSAAPKFDKRYTGSYSGMQELYNNSVHQTLIYVQPPLTLNEVSVVLPVWAQYLIGRELFHDILTGTNAKAGVEIYAPQFFARQLSFGQTWPIHPCYSKSFQERFHTITKVEAHTIDVRNAYLMTRFSLAPFNPTTVVHPLFEKFWPSVKRRLFATNVNHAFHLLEGLGSSRTSISSIPASIPAMPISIRRPVPSSSPSKSPLISTRRSATVFLQSSSLPVQTRVIKGASSYKRPALGSSDWPDDTSDDDDDAPPLIRRKDADAILRSIQDLFTSWEQVKVSHAVRSTSASRHSAASAAFSIENMNILKQAVLEYTSFMDMDIVNASTTSQRDKFERLSNQMA